VINNTPGLKQAASALQDDKDRFDRPTRDLRREQHWLRPTRCTAGSGFTFRFWRTRICRSRRRTAPGRAAESADRRGDRPRREVSFLHRRHAHRRRDPEASDERSRRLYFTALGLWVGGMAILASSSSRPRFRTARPSWPGSIFGDRSWGFGPSRSASDRRLARGGGPDEGGGCDSRTAADSLARSSPSCSWWSARAVIWPGHRARTGSLTNLIRSLRRPRQGAVRLAAPPVRPAGRRPGLLAASDCLALRPQR
jgi:hypothetical protein